MSDNGTGTAPAAEVQGPYRVEQRGAYRVVVGPTVPNGDIPPFSTSAKADAARLNAAYAAGVAAAGEVVARAEWADTTRNGTPVRIYATDAGGEYPIHGATKSDEEGWTLRTWCEDGSHVYDGVEPGPLDLIPRAAPPAAEVVIDGPGEYETEDGRLVTIDGARLDDGGWRGKLAGGVWWYSPDGNVAGYTKHPDRIVRKRPAAEVVTPSPEPQPEPFRVRGLGVYRNEAGQDVRIVRHDVNDRNMPWQDGEGLWYTAAGFCPGGAPRHNLVSYVGPLPSAEPTPAPAAEASEARTAEEVTLRDLLTWITTIVLLCRRDPREGTEIEPLNLGKPEHRADLVQVAGDLADAMLAARNGGAA